MARFAVSCKFTAGIPQAIGVLSDPLNASTTSTDSATVSTDVTTVDGNVATLVADGASPTQAHVTTLNTNWGTLKTAVAALQADLAAGQLGGNADVVLSFDAAVITTRSKLRQAVQALLIAVDGGVGGLTA